MKQILLVLLVGVLILLGTDSALATNQTVFISEVHPNPLLDLPEWVEIHNPNSVPIDLSGCTLFDQLSSPSLLFEFTATSIEASASVVIELTSQKLNNSGDSVILYCLESEKISSISYLSSVQGLSWHKDGQTSDPFQAEPSKDSLSTKPVTTPTMVQPSPTPTTMDIQPSTQISYAIEITEVYPCPTSEENEWIELYSSENHTVSLENWYFQDAQQNTVRLEEEILSDSFRVITLSRSMLNNQGDTLSLHTDDGALVDSVVIPTCSTGNSFGKDTDGKLQLSSKTTPGSINISTSAEIEPESESNNQITSVSTSKESPPPTSTPSAIHSIAPYSPKLKPIINGVNRSIYETIFPSRPKLETQADRQPVFFSAIIGFLCTLTSLLFTIPNLHEKKSLTL